MAKTLLTANKIVLDNIRLQSKNGIIGKIEPDSGYDGLSDVTIVGASILQCKSHEQPIGNKQHIFQLSEVTQDVYQMTITENGDTRYGLNHFVLEVNFEFIFNAGDEIYIKTSDGILTDGAFTCYNIYQGPGAADKRQAAVSGSFSSGTKDFLEFYRYYGAETQNAVVINPRVAIWTS